MVGLVTLLKMIHCKQLKRRRSSHEEYTDSDRSDESIKIDIKSEIDETVESICRVCLKSGNIPVYGNDSTDDISDYLRIFGGILIHSDDGYPNNLCESCFGLLQGAIVLRKTAQYSEKVLRKACDYEDIDIVDNDNDDPIELDEDQITVPTNTKQPKKINYNCKKCKIEFASFEEYSEHRLTPEHENMKQKCHICNNSYTSTYLKKHISIHKMETPYMCDVCGKKFVIHGHFTRHRLTHFYSLPFKCTLCPYKGRFSESLKMHMRTHTGERPYQCSECPSRFVSKSNLNKHMLTHKGGYGFKCESCSKGFYTKRDLEMHFKVDHTGLKEHVCNVCGKAFGYRKQMMKHQLKVHKRQKLRSGRMPLYLQVESKEQVIKT